MVRPLIFSMKRERMPAGSGRTAVFASFSIGSLASRAFAACMMRRFKVTGKPYRQLPLGDIHVREATSFHDLARAHDTIGTAAFALHRRWRRAGHCRHDRASKAAFDGQWSVLIVTEKGRCDRAYRYPVRIENGTVGYAGTASFNISGSVGNNGAVTVTVSRGSQSATAPAACRRPTARARGPQGRAIAPAPGPPNGAHRSPWKTIR